jgi:hypothetical protein
VTASSYSGSYTEVCGFSITCSQYGGFVYNYSQNLNPNTYSYYLSSNSILAGYNNVIGYGRNKNIIGCNITVTPYDETTYVNNLVVDSLRGTGGPLSVNAAGLLCLGAANLGIMVVGTGSGSTVRCGLSNTASGSQSTVSGGFTNTASCNRTTVGGGSSNTASNLYSTVGGGIRNTASGYNAIVSGGRCNVACGSQSTIGGGGCSRACGTRSTVGGGVCNSSSNSYSIIAGGFFNTASGYNATIGGGHCNIASCNMSTIGGGISNTASGCCSTIAGGSTNTASGCSSTVSGGLCNTNFTGNFSVIGGGLFNCTCSNTTFIGAGCKNEVRSTGGIIVGGECNLITNCGINSFIGGGFANCSCGCCGTISGGYGNGILSGATHSVIGGGHSNGILCGATHSVIGGGCDNCVNSSTSVISGGFSNAANGVYSSISGGFCGCAGLRGQRAYSSKPFAALGDAQHGQLIASNITDSGSGLSVLYLDGTGETSPIILPSGKAYFCIINVGGITDSGSAGAQFVRKVAIKNVGGVTSLIGAVSTIGTDADTTTGTSVTITANNATDSLTITVQGDEGLPMRWVATIDYVEIAYA